MGRKETNWQEFTPVEVLKKFRSDEKNGLSCKVVRSRRRKEGTPKSGVSSFGRWFKRFCSSPLFLILGVSSVLALCFGEIGEGISSLAFLAIFGVFLAGILSSMMEIEAKSVKYRVPMVRVLREGNTGFVSTSGIVPGDVIYLRQGDVVPCFCRLLASRDLGVSVLVTDPKSGEKTMQFLQKKAETVYPVGDSTPELYCENLLQTGSVIRCGKAKAVAVEYGKAENFYTSEEGEKKILPGSMNVFLTYSRFSEIFSLLFLMLNTVLGLLILPENLSILRIFLPICSLMLTGSSILFSLYLKAFWSKAKRRCFGKKENENACVLQTPASLDGLSGMTDLLLFGHDSISDGSLHFYGGLFGNETLTYHRFFEGEKREATLLSQAIGEAVYYLHLGIAEKSRGKFPMVNPYETLWREWKERMSFDREGSDVRLKRLCCPTFNDTAVVEAQLQDGTYRYAFTPEDPLTLTDFMLQEDGAAYSVNRAGRERITAFRKEMLGKGCRVISVLREFGDRVVLLGILALREKSVKHLFETMDRFENAGVRITVFLDSSDLSRTPMSAFWMKKPLPVSGDEIGRSDRSFEEFAEKYRVFYDIPRENVLSWIRTLSHSGRKVAGIGNSIRDAELLSACSLRISCDGNPYHEESFSEIVEDFPETVSAGGVRCPDAFRRDADVLIPGGTFAGGGLSTLWNALKICRETCGIIRYFVPVILAAFLFRMLVLGGCIWTGLGVPNAFWLLWTGIGSDLALFFASAVCKKGKAEKAGNAGKGDFFRFPAFWIRPIFAAGGLLFFLKLSQTMGFLTPEQCLTLAVTLMIPLQFLLLPAASLEFRPKKLFLLLAFFAVFLPLLVCVILSSKVEGVGAFFGFSAWNKTMLLLPIAVFAFVLIVNLPAWLTEKSGSR